MSGHWISELAPGAWVTVKLTLFAGALSIVVSAAAGLARLSRWRVVRGISLVYIDVFKSVPLLALLLLVYYGLGTYIEQLGISAFAAAVIVIVIVEGAYTAEIYQAAIMSVRQGQWDAATSLGMSRWAAYRLVILPQSLGPAVPPTINMIIYVVKGSALASLVTVPELMYHANELISLTFRPLDIYLIVMGYYLAMTIPLGYAGRYVEGRMRKRFGMVGRTV